MEALVVVILLINITVGIVWFENIHTRVYCILLNLFISCYILFIYGDIVLGTLDLKALALNVIIITFVLSIAYMVYSCHKTEDIEEKLKRERREVWRRKVIAQEIQEKIDAEREIIVQEFQERIDAENNKQKKDSSVYRKTRKKPAENV